MPKTAKHVAPGATHVIRDQVHVLSIAEGFYQSSVLFTLLKLQIFELIGVGRASAEELSETVGTHPDTLARLLNAGVMLKLLECAQDGAYCLSRASRSVLLPEAGENYLGNWIRQQDEFRGSLAALDEAVLKSRPTISPNTFFGADAPRTREYVLAMHNYAAVRGRQLAHYLDTTGCTTLLDVGCGPGTFAFHLAAKNPGLRLFLSDVPEVLEVTREIAARYPLNHQVRYLPMDLTSDRLPNSYDLILASNVLHSFPDKLVQEILGKLSAVVNPGGSLVVQAQYLQEDRQGGRWPIFVDLNLLTTTHGRNHTVLEMQRWMEDAGFVGVEYCPMSIYDANSFLRGYKRSAPGRDTGPEPEGDKR